MFDRMLLRWRLVQYILAINYLKSSVHVSPVQSIAPTITISQLLLVTVRVFGMCRMLPKRKRLTELLANTRRSLYHHHHHHHIRLIALDKMHGCLHR